MQTWRIWHFYLENGKQKEYSVYVKADNFDDALDEARKIDPRCSAGQVCIDA